MDTKTLCLGILTLGSASGYDIRKQLDETFSHFMDVSSSAVYPALKSLHKSAFVTFEKVAQESAPDKKVYTITEKGESVFNEALSVLSPRHRIRSEFLLLLFYADNLSPHRLQEIIETRISDLNHWKRYTNQWLKSEKCGQASTGQKFISDYAVNVMTAEIAYLENCAGGWVDRVSARQSAGEPEKRGKQHEPL